MLDSSYQKTFKITMELHFLSVKRLRFCHIIEPRHEISNHVICATSKASDQPAHMRSLIRAFACLLSIL